VKRIKERSRRKFYVDILPIINESFGRAKFWASLWMITQTNSGAILRRERID
jgi:hypothetical protein